MSEYVRRYETAMDIVSFLADIDDLRNFFNFLVKDAIKFAENNDGFSAFVIDRERNASFVDYNFLIASLARYVARVTGNSSLIELVKRDYSNLDLEEKGIFNKDNKIFLVNCLLGLIHRVSLTGLNTSRDKLYYTCQGYYTEVAYESSKKFFLRAVMLNKKRLIAIVEEKLIERLIALNEDIKQRGFGNKTIKKLRENDKDYKYLLDAF